MVVLGNVSAFFSCLTWALKALADCLSPAFFRIPVQTWTIYQNVLQIELASRAPSDRFKIQSRLRYG